MTRIPSRSIGSPNTRLTLAVSTRGGEKRIDVHGDPSWVRVWVQTMARRGGPGVSSPRARSGAVADRRSAIPRARCAAATTIVRRGGRRPQVTGSLSTPTRRRAARSATARARSRVPAVGHGRHREQHGVGHQRARQRGPPPRHHQRRGKGARRPDPERLPDQLVTGRLPRPHEIQRQRPPARQRSGARVTRPAGRRRRGCGRRTGRAARPPGRPAPGSPRPRPGSPASARPAGRSRPARR